MIKGSVWVVEERKQINKSTNQQINKSTNQ